MRRLLAFELYIERSAPVILTSFLHLFVLMAFLIPPFHHNVKRSERLPRVYMLYNFEQPKTGIANKSVVVIRERIRRPDGRPVQIKQSLTIALTGQIKIGNSLDRSWIGERSSTFDLFASPAVLGINHGQFEGPSHIGEAATKTNEELSITGAFNHYVLSCGVVTASFAITVTGDGKISDVRFTTGSAGPALGAHLATALE